MKSLAAQTAARREALAAVYRNIPRSVWFSILVTWAIAYLLWDAAHPGMLVAWASLLSALNLARFVHVLRRLRSRNFLDDPVRDERELALGVGLAGAGFGVGFLLFGLGAPLLEQYAVSLFLVGISAGSVTVLTGSRLAFLAYTKPMTLAIAVPMSWIGLVDADGPRLFLGLMMFLFGGAIHMFQKRLDRMFVHNIALRHEHLELLEQKEALLSELRSHNKELSADRDEFLLASLTDGLTGLANRRHFDRTLARDWERHRRDGAPLACILMDIDHFKNFNDRYGHMVGDDCLRAIAHIIDGTVSRGGDFAARYGGEEFVALLPGTGIDGARLLAERIREVVEERAIPHASGGPEGVVTLSAGVSALAPGSSFPSAQTLVDLADEALYLAKKRGRNQVTSRRAEDAQASRDGLAPGSTC
jgi:diguanylate cyclase (GGDEF)-like protein